MQSDEIGAIDPRIARALNQPGAWDAAQRAAGEAMQQADKNGARLVLWGDPDYPACLAQTPDAPFFLYVQGTLPAASTLAVLGTRNPTRLGGIVASKIAGHFAEQGVSIISGLALGIDSIAHEAALAASGHTVAVLGHGLQTIYPSRNGDLAKRILDQGGALVSEYHFGTPMVPHRLVERDRVQAGMSQAVVMVQSKRDGGSMHASRAALRYGRNLYIPSPLKEDLAGTDSAVEVPRLLLQGETGELAKVLKREPEGLHGVVLIRSRADYQSIRQYLEAESAGDYLSPGAEPML
jgi:DNA protecting protein DprA